MQCTSVEHDFKEGQSKLQKMERICSEAASHLACRAQGQQLTRSADWGCMVKKQQASVKRSEYLKQQGTSLFQDYTRNQTQPVDVTQAISSP